MLILGGDRGVGGGDLRGDLLVLGSAVMWAAFTVFGRRAVKRHGALEVTAWTLWVGAPILFAIGVPELVRTDWSTVSVGSWAAVVYAGTLAVSVAYLLWYRAIQRIGQSRTSIYANLVPVVALLVAWAWLGEVPRAIQLIGAGVILGGVAIAWRAPSMRAGDRGAEEGVAGRAEDRKTRRWVRGGLTYSLLISPLARELWLTALRRRTDLPPNPRRPTLSALIQRGTIPR